MHLAATAANSTSLLYCLSKCENRNRSLTGLDITRKNGICQYLHILRWSNSNSVAAIYNKFKKADKRLQ